MAGSVGKALDVMGAGAKLAGAPSWLVDAASAAAKAVGLLPEHSKGLVSGLLDRLAKSWAQAPPAGVADQDAELVRRYLLVRVAQTPLPVLLRCASTKTMLPCFVPPPAVGGLLLPKAADADRAAIDDYVQTVVDRVPDVLAGWVTGKDVVAAATQVTSGASLELVERLLGIVSQPAGTLDAVLKWWPPVSAKRLDLTSPVGPRLGSWMTAGSLPGYTPRAIDGELDGRLEAAAAAGGLVVVSGEPKSGKTRAVVESLGRVIPDRLVWSLLPAAGVSVDDGRLIDPIAQVAWQVSTGHYQAGQLVVVLDDLQTFLLAGPNQLTETRLRALTDLGLVVVATVHTEAVSRIRNHQQGNAVSDLRLAGSQALLSGEDRALLASIDAATVALSSELTDAELDRLAVDVAAAATARHISPERLRRLAEVLAAVDKMRTMVDEAEHDPNHPERQVLLKAAFAASVCYPFGATQDELRELYEWADPWQGNDFDRARRWAPAPIGGLDSLNALVTAADLPGTWRLFDAITSHLEAARYSQFDWLTPHLVKFHPAVTLFVGDYHLEQGRVSAAQLAYQVVIDSDHFNYTALAAFKLGLLEKKAGDLRSARAAYLLAIDSGHPDHSPAAAVNLGVLEEEEGDLPAAEAAYRLAIGSGHHSHVAALNLGALEREAVRDSPRREVPRLALEFSRFNRSLYLQVVMIVSGRPDKEPALPESPPSPRHPAP